MKYLSEEIISAAPIGVADAVSDPIKAQQLLYASAQAVVAGGTTPVGVLKLQFSNDPVKVNYEPQASTVTNWSDSSVTVAVSDNGVFLIPKTDLCYNWVRVIYDRTSGTGGTVTVNFNAIGA